MINEVAREIIRLFNVNKFVETGIHHGETLKTVIGWFSELYEDFVKDSNGRYKIFDVDIVKEYSEGSIETYGKENSNIVIANESSEEFLKRLVDENKLSDDDVCMFYLDAHWQEYWPLRDEIKEILRLKRSIILIDDFYTPGKPFGYDTYNGSRLDLNYIRDLINNRTDVIYYASIANRDNRGMAIIFVDYKEKELNVPLNGLPLIKEDLKDGRLTLLGRSGRILLMGIGKHGTRSFIPTQFFENYIDKCIDGHEIITFGYNEGCDIRINPEDDFSEVIRALPNQWRPDICILPNCEFSLLPKGIEQAPFPTVYIAYDWDYQVHTARTFIESVDYTIVFGEYAEKALTALGANNITIFYPHSAAKELFTPSPRKIKDRKYDICYTTFIDDVLHHDRSEWILTLCKFAEKYRVKIVPYTTFHNYLELLQDSKLAFSHQRLGEMSIRIFEACSQGTVTLETGSEVKKYFKPDHEYIPVTKETIEGQLRRYLKDDNLLQQMSERAYNKALYEYEPKSLFTNLIHRLYGLIEDYPFERRINHLSESERLIRRGEIYYCSFCRGLKRGSLINQYEDLLQKSILNFTKSIAIEPSPRGMNNLAVAETLLCFHYYSGVMLDKKVEEVAALLKRLIATYPTYAIAYFQLGLLYLRSGNHKDAIERFTQALDAFRDPGSTIDPWALYQVDIETDPKSTFVLGKPLNSALLSLSMGNIVEAMHNIKNVYEAATLYYLSVLYEKEGQILRSLESLMESLNLCPNTGIVAMRAAKVLAILGHEKDSIVMFKKAINLFPLDIDLRVEYIKHLYLYRIDKEVIEEIRNTLQIIKTIEVFKNKTILLKEAVERFYRFNSMNTVYSHDISKEFLLNNWIGILYDHLRKNNKDLNLIRRIIQIWQELGRIDKIFEILEEYIKNHLNKENVDNTTLFNLDDICNYLQVTYDSQNKWFDEKLNILNNLIKDIKHGTV